MTHAGPVAAVAPEEAKVVICLAVCESSEDQLGEQRSSALAPKTHSDRLSSNGSKSGAVCEAETDALVGEGCESGQVSEGQPRRRKRAHHCTA